MEALRDNIPDYVDRAPREGIARETAIVESSGRLIEARLCNLSDAGFMGECDECLPIGGRITAALPGRTAVAAEIRWMLGSRFGAAFL